MTIRIPEGIQVTGSTDWPHKPGQDAALYRSARLRAATGSEMFCEDYPFEIIVNRSERIAAALDPLADYGFISINSPQPAVYGMLGRKLEHRGSGDVSLFDKCTIAGWAGYSRFQTTESELSVLKTLSFGRETASGTPARDAPSELKKERAKAELDKLLVMSNVEDSEGAAELREALTTFLYRFGAAAVGAVDEKLSRARLAGDQHILLLDALASVDDPDTLTIRTYALGKALASSDPAMRHKASSCLSEMRTELAKSILRDHLGVEKNTLVRQRIELELA